jgi:hypothetical protein
MWRSNASIGRPVSRFYNIYKVKRHFDYFSLIHTVRGSMTGSSSIAAIVNAGINRFCSCCARCDARFSKNDE